MFKTVKYMLLTLALSLTFVSVSFAQFPTASPTPSQANDPAERNFRSRVFEIKHRDPGTLANALYGLGSGFKGSMISANADFKTISVRDFPEHLTTIEEAIKRLDVPAAPHPDIEVHMYVLIASNAVGVNSEVPTELKDVLTQLRSTLNYRNYELVASVVQRGTDSPRGFHGVGEADVPNPNPATPRTPMPYEYTLKNIALVHNPAGGPTLQIGEFTFTTTGSQDRARVQTALNLRDGERVVVGTATHPEPRSGDCVDGEID